MDQVAQIREKIDIVSLISEFIPLKKAGRNFKANCPFHNEKTPSFVVSSERQIWHCFGGCAKGGDVFTFLMEYEHIEFKEALRILAKKAGIELEESKFNKAETSLKERIYSLNRLSAEFYHYLLVNHNVGKKALEYLKKRGISSSAIDAYFLGYAPKIGNNLSRYLVQKKGYKKEDLFEAGLSFLRRGELHDFFIDRIIFPLFDHRGNVIGFSGRILDLYANLENASQSSKYINTKETFVYHKGSTFFGINKAIGEIKKEGRAIIMEGEFDVISSFQLGIKNVVAVKGTALTENQINLLSRFTQKVSFCFDQDLAGQEALKRSILLIEKKGLTASVIVIDNGKDPDESIKNDPIIFKKAVKDDIAIYDFILEKTLSLFDQKTVEGKRKISDELLFYFSQIENEIIKEHYLRLLSKELSVSFESIVKQAEKIKNKLLLSHTSFIQKTQVNPTDKKTQEEILESYLIALLIQNKNLISTFEKIKVFLEELNFTIPAYGKIFIKLLQYIEQRKSFEINEFSKILPQEVLSAFDACFLFPIPKFENDNLYEEEIKKIIQKIKALSLKNKIKQLTEQIKLIEKEGKFKEAESLQSELVKLTASLSFLNF